MILHKVGAQRRIARIMITWGLLSAATMIVNSPTTFYMIGCILGAPEAGFSPASSAGQLSGWIRRSMTFKPN